MRYIQGSVKKGRKTYFFIKDSVTGQMDKQCTRYLKHKVMHYTTRLFVNTLFSKKPKFKNLCKSFTKK